MVRRNKRKKRKKKREKETKGWIFFSSIFLRGNDINVFYGKKKNNNNNVNAWEMFSVYRLLQFFFLTLLQDVITCCL